MRVEMEKEVRKVRRAETGLEAARESVTARTEMRRITANQVEAKTVNPSALKEADAQLAEAEAGLFQAEMERSAARAELERTVGREIAPQRSISRGIVTGFGLPLFLQSVLGQCPTLLGV